MTTLINIARDTIFSIGLNPHSFLSFLFLSLISLSIFNKDKFKIDKRIIKYSTLFLIVLKMIFSYEKFLEINQDSVAWVITAIRMDELNFFEYQASWDHKGSIIYWIYFLIYKFVRISDNLWVNYSAMFLLFSLIVSYYCYKLLLNKKRDNELLCFSISLLTFLSLTFSPGEGYPVFDTRFVGSSLIFFSIYQINKRNLNSAAVYLALAVVCLPSYSLTAISILIYMLYMNRNSNILKKILVNFSGVFFFYFLYLLVTNQLYDFFNLSIKYNFMLRGVGNYYPFERVLENNIYLFLFFGISFILIKYLYKKFGELFLLVFLWGFLSILHLVLTGPRFVQYDQLIVIPLNLLGYFVIYWLIDFIKLQKDKKIINKLLVLIVLLIPLNIISKSIVSSTEITNIEIIELKNSAREIINFNQSSIIYDEKPEFAIFFVDGKDWKTLIDKYNFLPSTRMWQPFWHKRDSGWPEFFNWDSLVSDDEFQKLFFNDINLEKPKFAIIDASYTESFNNYLYSYVMNNYEKIKCEEKYCIYEMSN